MNGPSKVPTQWAIAHPVPVGWMRQFRYFAWLYSKIREVPGDVVECGLGEGNTFAMLAYLVGSENEGGQSRRTLLGFDSFEGWPEPTAWDASPRNPQAGEWRVSGEMVRHQLEESGVKREFPELQIRVVKGFFDTTLPRFPKDQIAFLHIDADLYPGYRDALIHLFPKVTPGGVVAFDEYLEFPRTPEYDNGTIEKWPGCTRAVNEYFANRPEELKFHKESGKYYTIKVAT